MIFQISLISFGYNLGDENMIQDGEHHRPRGRIDHFTVVCLVAWPLNESEAGGDVVLIETSLPFLCKFVVISMRTTSLK